MKWDELTIEMHGSPEQINRIESIADVSFHELDKLSNTGVTADGYTVSLDHCSCDDFKERNRPCTHIYALAKKVKKMELNRVIQLSETLIADFSSGYAAGWAFIVSKYNWAGLDILYTDRVKEIDGTRQKISIPTQGIDYLFGNGTTFYDDIRAYQLPWGEAIKVIDFYLEIHSSYANKKPYEFNKENGILFVNPKFEYGTTTFDITRINHETGELEKPRRYYCYNDEFVKLLQFGYCVSTTGEIINKDEWKR